MQMKLFRIPPLVEVIIKTCKEGGLMIVWGWIQLLTVFLNDIFLLCLRDFININEYAN